MRDRPSGLRGGMRASYACCACYGAVCSMQALQALPCPALVPPLPIAPLSTDMHVGLRQRQLYVSPSVRSRATGATVPSPARCALAEALAPHGAVVLPVARRTNK